MWPRKDEYIYKEEEEIERKAVSLREKTQNEYV